MPEPTGPATPTRSLLAAKQTFRVTVSYHGSPAPVQDEIIHLPAGWQAMPGGTFVASEPSGVSARAGTCSTGESIISVSIYTRKEQKTQKILLVFTTFHERQIELKIY